MKKPARQAPKAAPHTQACYSIAGFSDGLGVSRSLTYKLLKAGPPEAPKNVKVAGRNLIYESPKEYAERRAREQQAG